MAEDSTGSSVVDSGLSTSPQSTAELSDGIVGRSRVDVDLDDVEFLCSLKMNLTKVASLLGVSRSIMWTCDRKLYRNN